MKNMAKRILAMLCAMTIMMSVIALPEFGLKAEAAEGLDLTQMQIVTPASATSVENKAVTELRNYIKSITGVSLTVKKEGQNSGAGIYIGNTQFAADNGVTYPTEGDEKGEAWAIQAVDGNLVLVGAPKRGVLYAVFHLLEDVLGVRWWNIWEEYVPSGNAIVPADYTDSGVPAFEYREAFVGADNTGDYLFYARNRLNGNHTNINSYYGGEEGYGGAHVHTFCRYFNQSDFNAHPEWFSLYNGSRVWGGQLCLSNSQLRDAYAEKLIKRVADTPERIHSVSPDDNERFCQCSSCQSAINTYGYSGYILNFVNDMAGRVKAAGYTDTPIEMLAYWTYIAPPKGGVKPAENVQVRFADNTMDLLHGLSHPNNAQTLAYLRGWAEITDNKLYYWQYVVNYLNNGVFPSMFYYGDDVAILQELGVDGWFGEQENSANTDFWDMKLWLLTKQMENPVSGGEYEALMDEFIYGYYGEAAGKYIRDYLYYMHEKAEATNAFKDFGDNTIAVEWLSVQDIIYGNACFEKAVAAAKNDETLLRRLRCARSGLDRAITENYVKWQSQAAAAGLSLPFTQREVNVRLGVTFAEQYALRGAYESSDIFTYYDGYSIDTPGLPSSLGIDQGHYMVHDAKDMRARSLHASMSVVEDADSVTGMALKCDSASNSAINLNSATSFHTLYYYYKNAATGKDVSSKVGTIKASNIKTDQGYQLYSFTWTVPAAIVNTSGSQEYFYLFSNWSFQDTRWGDELQPFAGKTVTVYLSMKVEGAAYGSGSAPVYYFDRIIVVPYTQKTHSYAYQTDLYGAGCRKVCTICGDVQRTAHNWNSGTITQKPTIEAEGQAIYTCLTCGSSKHQTIDKLPAPVSTWNLELDGNIGINFVLNVKAEDAAKATAAVTVNGETTTKNVADLLVDGQYILTCDLAAAQMTDEVTVTVTVDGAKWEKTYSVRAYADVILGSAEYSDAVKNLVKAMLTYGAASQTYFDYNVDSLANAGVDYTLADPAESNTFRVSGSAEGVECYGASLVHKNKIAVRVYFSGDITGKTFTVNGKSATPVAKDGKYYVEAENICPQDLDQSITVAVGGLTVTYAPMDYIARMYEKGGDSAALVKALYGYYLAAESYDN